MKRIFLAFLIITTIIAYSKGLDCGISKNNDELRQTIAVCLKTNKSMEDIWDLTSSDSDSSSSSSEDQSVYYSTTQRNRRQQRSTSSSSITNEDSDQLNSPNDTSPTATTYTEDVVADNCLAHCIFMNLGLTDGNGYPEHNKIVDGLLKTASGRELRDFLQDSIDECFQEVDKENNVDTCLYSSKLVTCIAERGKLNCDDWPVGNLPFHL